MTSTIAAAASARPVPLRRRPDLEVFPQRFSGRTVLTIKDPLTLRYYQLYEEEFYILQRLDGRTSLAEIQDAVQREFAPRHVSLRQLQAYLAMLHREGLITADAEGQGLMLWTRGREALRRQRVASLASVLAWRFRGWDPEPFLNALYPKLRWCFSRTALLGMGLLIAAAVGLVVLRLDEVAARLPELPAFLTADSLLWLAVTIAGTKLLHELGHGLTCKHFGGQCREAGVMLLAFVPCLYVNVSDAWTLPNKWQRIAISSAGILMELSLAAACTFLWWFSEPGLLNSLCLYVMLVCSINTLVFNGNPLLRYDGYYVLSDLVAVPNLAQRATALFWNGVSRLALGVDLGPERLAPHRHQLLLLTYAVASWLYRIIAVAAILWFLHAALKPSGLQSVVHVLTLLVVAGMFGSPLYHALRLVTNPTWASRVNKTRSLILAATLALAATGLLAVPLPGRVTAPALVQLKDARTVYVAVPGTLRWAAPAGRHVAQGERIAQLVNQELDLEIARLRGEQEACAAELAGLRQRSAQQAGRGGAAIGSQIPAAEKALQDVASRLENALQEQQRLTLTAPRAGTVVPATRHDPHAAPDQLPLWSDDPLEPINRNAYLDIGTPLCRIGDPHELEAVLVVEQAAIQRVAVGRPVHVRLDQLPGWFVGGQVAEIAKMDVQTAPPELAASGLLPLQMDARSRHRLRDVFYRVRVELEDHPEHLLPGGIGQARIHVPPVSLADRIRNYLCATFRFRL
jgi:putative peptide zinc metalloprotease protein